jgi:hypothetical protein
MNYKKLVTSAGAAVAGLAAPWVALATPWDQAQVYMRNVSTGAGFVGGTPDLPTIVGKIINVVLGFLGIILLFYVLYAGFLWMTSGGEDKKAKEARTMLMNAVVGLVIIVAAFAISNFVMGSIISSAGNA